MADILLNEPVPSHHDLERLHLFPGRHLGEEEFDRLQAYADRRLQPLLGAAHPGIVHGLRVRLASLAADTEGFTVAPGIAIAGNGKTLGLYYPLRQSWQGLIEQYREQTHAIDVTGVYYLVLQRSERYIDADPDTDPCERTEIDPTRDSRLVVAGTLTLKRLAVAGTAADGQSRERLENWVAANHVDGAFLQSMDNAVPLGLLAIGASVAKEGEGEEEDEGEGDAEPASPQSQVLWFSEACGRYEARPHAGYEVLLQQTQQAFQRLMQAADASEDQSLEEFLNANLQMDFLPAAGQLPLELLQDAATLNPRLLWLPRHLRIDMVAVPEEAVQELIARHLPRRVVDLRQAAGEHLRLLLAVNEPDYSPQLLDYPQTDGQLQQDLYRYFMRAHDVWRDWVAQFNRLYFVTEEDVLAPGEIAALDLPEPVASPQLPEAVFAALIARATEELAEPGEEPPYPYGGGIPDYPAFYRRWGAAATEGATVQPPPVGDPDEDGLVIQHAVASAELEALDNEIRALRSRLEKTRDYVMLQRQQLDNQTVSLAALAGGVAGDGSGLQVARWLPFANLKQKVQTSENKG